jgi:hypothetical protein
MFKNYSRMGTWLLISILLTLGIYLVAPHMLKVAAFKLSLITIAAYVGYWLSRAVERGARPHELITRAGTIEVSDAFQGGRGEDRQRAARDEAYELRKQANQIMWRRTALICACMIAAALGS